MKKRRKAQVSVFIILSILLVVGFLLFFLMKSETKKELINPQFANVYPFVDACIKTIGEESLLHVGQTGGYFLKSKNSNQAGMAYHFDKDRSLLPSKKDIENELSEHMNKLLFFCTKNFVNFPDLDIEQGKIETNTYIVQGKIRFNIKYPLKIKKGDRISYIESFEKEIPLRLNTIHNVLTSINLEQMLDFDNICINCLSDIAFENEIFISMNDDLFDEDTIIFEIIDDKIKLNEDPYRFYFAHRYR
jgi:hypothetical protein